ncbi:hypothetical protein F5Y11DRAFT_346038 [Daldinia sp. FL1419]|nr:hypothetical protein F5Y11DRAFT_346038 [Daldinia sp. FL1419]
MAEKDTSSGPTTTIGDAPKKHPADMTEKEWEVVVKNDILTHAYRIDTNARSAVRRPAEIFVVDDDQSSVDTTIPEFQVFDDYSASVVEVTNKFPQVIVYLDHESLEPTEECQKHFDAITSEIDASISKGKIKAFKAKYGMYFQPSAAQGGP